MQWPDHFHHFAILSKRLDTLETPEKFWKRSMKIAHKPHPRNRWIHIMRLQKNPDSFHENRPLSAPKNRPQTKHCWSGFRAACRPYDEIIGESKLPKPSFPLCA
jgi:hypothetical protein